MPGARILHLSDSHIGADLATRTNRARRGDDFIASFERVLAPAEKLGVELIIHSGDLFDSPRPSSRAILAATEPLRALACKGVKVVLIPGNHERDALSSNLLLAHPNIHIAMTPATWMFSLSGVRIAISAFGCLRRVAAAKFEQAVAATRWRDHDADARILAVHEAFDSAVCGPANFRFKPREDVVERRLIPTAFDYVAAGHVHRHQILNADERIKVVYAGSTDRISFAEIGEPKGCVLIEVSNAGVSHRFVEHAVRPMDIHPLDITGLNRSALMESVASYVSALPEGAVAQVRLAGFAVNGTLRDLNLVKLGQELRPDVLLSVSFRGVEYGCSGGEVGRSRRKSPFDALDAPRGDTIRAPADDLARIPNSPGVYALFDGNNHLLYVGKSKQGRTRVRSHLAGRKGSNYFADWSSSVAAVEFRPAGSEFEAILVEAELIRLLRPPFNLQMRRWRRYVYLCSRTGRIEDLEKYSQPVGRLCVGPFRSSRQANELAAILLATHVDLALRNRPHETDRIVRLFLMAADDSLIDCMRGTTIMTARRGGKRKVPIDEIRESLGAAFRRLKLLKAAATFIGKSISLRNGDQLLYAKFKAQGISFHDAGELDGLEHPFPGQTKRTAWPCLPKATADVLCLAARHCRLVTNPTELDLLGARVSILPM